MKWTNKTLKILTATSAFVGVIVSVFSALDDNFTHRYKRLMYFTAQSNLWIGITFTLVLLFPLFRLKNKEKWERTLYIIKYIFTVSITMTGLVFCAVLAPFAPPDYRAWEFCNVLTHVVTPTLAIADFIVEKKRIRLTARHVFASLLPPFFYFTTASILGAFHFDFGRGEPYPYFFMNYHSPAGVFGFVREQPFIGSFYWWAVFIALMLLIAYAYAKINARRKARKKTNKKF